MPVGSRNFTTSVVIAKFLLPFYPLLNTIISFSGVFFKYASVGMPVVRDASINTIVQSLLGIVWVAESST